MKPDEKIESSIESQVVQEEDGSSTPGVSASQPSLEAIPKVNDRWDIIEFLGEGGMSVVYKARHKVMGKFSAIKLLHKHLAYQGNNLLRFQQESIAAGNIDHENVISVIDCGITEDEQPFLIMEYLPGKSLAQLISTNGKLEAERAFVIFKQICAGMQAAHNKGVVHRDLKPSNVMLVDNKNRADFVKIVDFGIAKLLPQQQSDELSKHQLTQTGEVFGSPLYMSPEQCSGQKPDERSDIYSLGCLMYETLCGKPPLMGASYVETMFMQMNDTPRQFTKDGDFNALAGRLEQVIFKCVAKDPADRYQSMSELEADLDLAHVGWLPWMLKGRAVRDLPGIWQKVNRRRIALVNTLIVCAIVFVIVAGTATYFGVSTYLSFQQMRNSIDGLAWWPDPPESGDPLDINEEKACGIGESLAKRSFDRQDVESEKDYIVCILKHAELLARGGRFKKAREKLLLANDAPMAVLRKTDPQFAKEEQQAIDLQLSECDYILDPTSIPKAKNFYELVDSEVRKNGTNSPHYKFWLEIAPRYADLLRQSSEPAGNFLQALASRHALRKRFQLTHSADIKQEIRGLKRYLHETAFPYWQCSRIYDTVAENNRNPAQVTMHIDPELSAKCLDGQALLEERYGITDNTIKQYDLPDESPEVLYQKAMDLAKAIPPPRGKAIYAKIGMDYADYLEKSDRINGFLKAWALRQQLIERFKN